MGIPIRSPIVSPWGPHNPDRRVKCNQEGVAHVLGMPSVQIVPSDFALKGVGGAMCVVCRRTFITPVFHIPARFMLGFNSAARVQQFVSRWAFAWIAHEAERPN